VDVKRGINTNEHIIALESLCKELAGLYCVRWSAQYGGGFHGEHGEMYESARQESEHRMEELKERISFLERYAGSAEKRQIWEQGKSEFVYYVLERMDTEKYTNMRDAVRRLYSEFVFPSGWNWTEEKCYRYVKTIRSNT
jgi:hypothetical protein